MAEIVKTIDNFNYINSAVLTPMFLVAGTLFPISALPRALRDIAHAAVIVGFATVVWQLAVMRMQSRLID